MTQRNRKFLGVFLMLGLLFIYTGLATAIYVSMFTEIPTVLKLLFFAITGFGWVFPAGILIKWMARPDQIETDPS